MSRVVIFERFGGPDQLLLRQTAEPHPGPGEARVRVTAIGLNPMDWMISSTPGLAAAFGVSVPSGFAHDFAGVIDEISDTTLGYAVGDRVFGSVSNRAAAEYLNIGRDDTVYRTPDGIPDDVASTLTVAGLTASAALSVIGVSSADTVLIGGAAGSVGVFAVQLAKLAGATVIGTAASTTAPFLRELGTHRPRPTAQDLSTNPGQTARINYKSRRRGLQEDCPQPGRSASRS